MTKKLTIGSESFDYSVTGDINYGEQNTDWAEAATDAINEFFGPGDIKTTEALLLNNNTGPISGLSFDTSFVQRITVTGIITRKISSPASTQVEAFSIEGAYNGTEFNISIEFTGDETEVELSMVGGQVHYTAADVTNTSELKIKYQARTMIDEDLV